MSGKQLCQWQTMHHTVFYFFIDRAGLKTMQPHWARASGALENSVE